MKSAEFVRVVIASAAVCALMHALDDGLAQETSRNSDSLTKAPVDELVHKVLPLYPGVRTQRSDTRAPFIADVQQLARLPLADGTERLVLLVHVTVPAARFDHTYAELLIFEDAADQQPFVRDGLHRMRSLRDLEVIGRHWLKLETHGPFVSLTDIDSLKYLRDRGPGVLIHEMSVAAARQALDIYKTEGRNAFLAAASIAPHRQRHVKLPDRIRHFDIYPGLVDEQRESRFEYSDAWEGTVLVRLTPARDGSKPIVLEMGARAPYFGIEVEDVEVFVWETRGEEPMDRPGPSVRPSD